MPEQVDINAHLYLADFHHGHIEAWDGEEFPHDISWNNDFVQLFHISELSS